MIARPEHGRGFVMAVLGQYGVTEPGIELLQNRRAEEQVLLVLG